MHRLQEDPRGDRRRCRDDRRSIAPLKTPGLSVVGQSVPRLDAREKVTGQARYTVDCVLPGMIHGAILGSPLPHANIGAIDTSVARRLPGVLGVLTCEDVRDIHPYYGHAIKDRPLSAMEKVRFVGEPVAAVAAVDPLVAREALDLIRVDYQELPPVLDVEAALAEDAPLVHESRAGGPVARGAGGQGSNICHHASYEYGNVAEAFARAAHVFEHTFTFPMVYHYAMEPHAVIASVDGGRITVWTSAQHPFLVQAELASIFGRPLEAVRVVVPYVGGGFGSKSYTKIEPLVVALARKAGRPVRVSLSVGEAFHTTRRHSARVHLRTALDAEGCFVAREGTIWLDTGAYADNGPGVADRAANRILGGYRCENVRVNAYAVYTNTVPAGSFRSIGGPQATWANESQVDMIADSLGIDPLELRLRNVLNPGQTLRPGQRPIDTDLGDGLRRVAAAIGWNRPAPQGEGRGLAVGITDAGAEPVATAIVRLHHDGSATVHESSTEIGQGVRTIL
ncbi:MAG: xanthine dehydrogenase family protein molybdopterin-binding subunit, partial [Armatimonadota bacterium]